MIILIDSGKSLAQVQHPYMMKALSKLGIERDFLRSERIKQEIMQTRNQSLLRMKRGKTSCYTCKIC